MVTLNNDGTVVFRLYAPHADHVELLGDFTKWEHGRLDLAREHARVFAAGGNGDACIEATPTGWWSIAVKIPPGDHAFCYLVDGRCWMPDYAAGGVKRNEYGNWVSLISVVRAVPGQPIDAPLDAEPRPNAEVAEAGLRETRAITHMARAETTRESWRIEGCCDAVHPW